MMKFIWKTHTHKNLIIKLLKYLIQIVAFQISQFFVCMWINKSYMQVLLVYYRMTVFWLIINSVDFRSVLMLKLADIEVSYNNLFLKMQKIWQITVKMNSVIITQFFHQICIDIFKIFIIADINQIDIFDQISNYFDVIKINKKIYFIFISWSDLWAILNFTIYEHNCKVMLYTLLKWFSSSSLLSNASLIWQLKI